MGRTRATGGVQGPTGALVAAMMDMQLRRAMPAIILGVLIAGIIVTMITFGAGALLSR